MLRYFSPHTGRSRRRPWAGRTRLRGGDDDGGRTGATVSHRRTERRPLRLLPCPRMRSDASRDAPDHHGPSWGGHGLPPGCNLRELPPDRGRDRLLPHVRIGSALDSATEQLLHELKESPTDSAKLMVRVAPRRRTLVPISAAAIACWNKDDPIHGI